MDNRAQPSAPAARGDGLLIEELGDELVVYDDETKEAHALGPLAAAVFSAADGRRSVAELADRAAERLDRPVSADEVWEALVQLEEHHLLEPPAGGMSRRAFVRRSAAVAFAAPLITSLAMPSLASAASCATTKACTVNTDCYVGGKKLSRKCSGNCNSCLCATVTGLPCPTDIVGCKETVNTQGYCGWI